MWTRQTPKKRLFVAYDYWIIRLAVLAATIRLDYGELICYVRKGH
jgi:hypothetical protein